MPKEKSSVKEIVINVLILAAAGGILAWRYNDCKEKEQQAEKAAQEARATEQKELEQRTNACLKTVPEAERNECTRCTCSACLDAVEACEADKGCRSLSLDTLLKDGGPPADDPARIRYESRAACMLAKCNQACTGKK